MKIQGLGLNSMQPSKNFNSRWRSF